MIKFRTVYGQLVEMVEYGQLVEMVEYGSGMWRVCRKALALSLPTG